MLVWRVTDGVDISVGKTAEVVDRSECMLKTLFFLTGFCGQFCVVRWKKWASSEISSALRYFICFC